MPSPTRKAEQLVRRAQAVTAHGLHRVGDRIARIGADHAPPASPELPLPTGVTEAQVTEVMHTFSVNGSPDGALGVYVDDAIWRFLHTFGLVHDQRGRLLELGSNPYFLTWLVEDFTDLTVTCTNFQAGDRPVLSETLSYRDLDGKVHDRVIDSDQFNLEHDRFPYEDASFDVVLFCEVIEHLLRDPLHALREIRRVLRPGGILVLTTPNVARLGNVLGLLNGANIYDPYSGHGPYGRHNREYNRHELHRLLEHAGYSVTTSFTADAHAVKYEDLPGYQGVWAAMPASRAPDLGQYLFVVAVPDRVRQPGYPTWLYRDMNPAQAPTA